MAELTEEDLYNFDTAGWLHLQCVYSPSELQTASAALAIDGAANASEVACRLAHHPALKSRIATLVASANHAEVDSVLDEAGRLTLKMNGAATLVGGAGCSPCEQQLAGALGSDGTIDTTRTYFNEAGHRYVHGIVIVWALTEGEPAGGYSVVSASHKSTLPLPDELLRVPSNGGDDGPLRNLGLLRQPELKPGDVLLVSSATLQGARCQSSGMNGPQLLKCEYLSRRARLSVEIPAHQEIDEEPWMKELSPVQRTLIGLEPQHRSAHDRLPTIRADEGKVWLEPEPSTGQAIHHARALVPNPEWSIQQRQEFALWELGGYLILRDVMDSEWLAQANAAIEWAKRQPAGSEHSIPTGAQRPKGQTGQYLRPLALPQPHCQPFRRMLACPKVVQRLSMIMGSGFVHYGSAPVRLTDKGFGGQRIHAGLMDREMDYHYVKIINGRSYAESVNVSWQLSDHCPLGGGLHVVPGSHKASYRMPDTLSIHPVTKAEGPLPQCAVHPDTRAGDVVIFSGMGTGHGVGQWKSDHQRRIVIMGYLSRAYSEETRLNGHFGRSGFLHPKL